MELNDSYFERLRVTGSQSTTKEAQSTTKYILCETWWKTLCAFV